MKTDFNEERKTKNELRRTFYSGARIRATIGAVILSFFVPSAFADVSSYRDILATLELARSAKAAKQLAAQAEMYASVESFADLRLWYLRNTQPKIFVEIETASAATDMGYFRLDFNEAGKIGKLRMLREEFGVK